MSETNSFTILKNVIGAFKQSGWVNGLTDNQYAALNKGLEFINKIEFVNKKKIADRRDAIILKKEGKSLRYIAEKLGYSHPQKVKNLIGNTIKK